MAGGSVQKGVLNVGQEIEVRPHVVSKDSEGKFMFLLLFAEHNDRQYAALHGG